MKRGILIKKSKIYFFFFCVFLVLVISIGLYFTRSRWLPYDDNSINMTDPVITTAQSMADQCQSSSSREYCYAGLFTTYTKKNDLQSSLKVLKALQDIDIAARGCHFIAHSISYAEATKNIKDWKKTLETVPVSLCTGGFVHGILEAYKNLNPDFVLTARSIESICEDVKGHANNGGEYSCAHIMGHLLMVDAKGDISKALSVCKDIKNNLLYECYSGSFMENETRENLFSHQILPHIPWNKETLANQQALCMQQTSPLAQQACWKEISHMIVFISKNDPAPVYTFCNNAPAQDAKDECYGHAVGIIMSSSKLDEAKMPKLCEPYTGDKMRSYGCMARAINASLMSSPKYASRTMQFCESFAGQQQTDCYKDIGYRLMQMVPDDAERANLCKSAPKIYQDYCQGIGILINRG